MSEFPIDGVSARGLLSDLPEAPRRRIRFTPEFEATLRQLYIRLMVEPVPPRLLAILRPSCDGKT
jgi:hypothetical protein